MMPLIVIDIMTSF